MNKYAGTCEYVYKDGKTICANKVSQKVMDYSLDHFNKVLCYGHQKQGLAYYESKADWNNIDGINRTTEEVTE
jgi:hypothetical protein